MPLVFMYDSDDVQQYICYNPVKIQTSAYLQIILNHSVFPWLWLSFQTDPQYMWYTTIVLGSGEELKGDATSGVLELKLIWFRFAAPSHKHSQVEYTRYCNNHCESCIR